MKQKTVTQLLELNKKFYNFNAKEFSQSRQSAWNGWRRIIPYFTQLKSPDLNVLDLGCGNGRFLSFLLTKLTTFFYVGIEENKQLLTEAKKIKTPKTVTTSFKQADILTLTPTDLVSEKQQTSAQHLVITLFGVLH